MRVAAGAVKAAILGAADGVTSISGVVAGGAAAGVGHLALALTALGGVLAATVSMAGAELLSEERTDWGAINSMAVGTVLGAGLPVIPLFVASGLVAWGAVVGLALGVAAAVGETRHRVGSRGRLRSYLLTAAVLGTGAAVGYGAGEVGKILVPGLGTG